MDKITTEVGTTHAMEGFPSHRGAGARAHTWCGKVVYGHTGATIASGIDCGSCKRSMRKAGWLV